jgi:hypothetical protein
MWLLTGRAIGLARAAHDLAAAGYDVEVVPVIRSLHEATRFAALANFEGEEPLLQRWLRGRKVERKDIVAALDRQEQTMRAEMTKEGMQPPDATKRGFDLQHGRWSDLAHHRRAHLLDQVSVSARVMAAGRHPDWRSRAALVDHYGWHVLGLVSTGGSALARLLGPEWFHSRFQPTYRALRALQDKVPLVEIAKGSQGERPPGAPGGA